MSNRFPKKFIVQPKFVRNTACPKNFRLFNTSMLNKHYTKIIMQIYCARSQTFWCCSEIFPINLLVSNRVPMSVVGWNRNSKVLDTDWHLYSTYSAATQSAIVSQFCTNTNWPASITHGVRYTGWFRKNVFFYCSIMGVNLATTYTNRTISESLCWDIWENTGFASLAYVVSWWHAWRNRWPNTGGGILQ